MGKWIDISFEEIVDNFDGKRIPIKASERKNSEGGKYPYYGASGIIDYVDDFIFEGEHLLISEDGANLLARVYPIAFKADGKFWVNNHAHIVKAKEDKTTNDYLEYYFSSIDISDYVTGSAQPKLNQRKLNSIKIPLPPLPEQQRIVKKLDGLFAKIDQAMGLLEDNIAHTQALMGSVLDEEFNKRKNVKYIKASEIGKVIRGSSPRPKGDPKYYGGNVPRLMVADVTRDGMYVTPNIDFLTEDGKLKSRPCPKGTLTIQVSGNPGTPSILEVDACIHDGFAAIINIDDNKWSKRFLYHYLILKKLEYSQLAKGATFQNIKTDIIRDFDIPLIGKNDQEKISNNIENKNKTIQLLVDSQTKKLNHLKALKSSLLDQAFKGELLKEDVFETEKQRIKTSFEDIFESINYDYEVATIVLQTWQELKINYGKKFIHKIFSNIQFMEELPVFEDLQFKENPWGMYCPILEKTIKNKTFIKFDDINDDRSVLSFNYKYLKEINHWMISKDENKDFVNRVKNMLSIYQKPLIDKSMDRIELFNTVLQCMAILETDNLEAIRSKMKKWKMIEGDYKNKAEKFKPRETELMIGLIKDIK